MARGRGLGDQHRHGSSVALGAGFAGRFGSSEIAQRRHVVLPRAGQTGFGARVRDFEQDAAAQPIHRVGFAHSRAGGDRGHQQPRHALLCAVDKAVIL